MASKITLDVKSHAPIEHWSIKPYRHPKPEELAREFFNSQPNEHGQSEANLDHLHIDCSIGDWADDWSDDVENSTQNPENLEDVESKIEQFIAIVAPFQAKAKEPNDPRYDVGIARLNFEQLKANLGNL